ncbi:MAG: 50S ribosomal protein L19 [Fibrobacteria bacterium]|nr:50S ribosomal protein L19 [Fibrobacteria bacterium]
MHSIVEKIEKESIRTDIPDFRAGDTISVSVRVREGSKERIQIFTGVVLQRRGCGLTETCTVRKISAHIPVERIFPIHAPLIKEIKVTRTGKVRRARIFYLRELQGKATRIKERKVDNKKA